MGDFIVDGRRVFVPKIVVGGVPSAGNWDTFSGTAADIVSVGVNTSMNVDSVSIAKANNDKAIVAYTDRNSTLRVRVAVIDASDVSGLPVQEQETALSEFASTITWGNDVTIDPIPGTSDLYMVGCSSSQSDIMRFTVIQYNTATSTLTQSNHSHDVPAITGTNNSGDTFKMIDGTRMVQISESNNQEVITTYQVSFGASQLNDPFTIAQVGINSFSIRNTVFETNTIPNTITVVNPSLIYVAQYVDSASDVYFGGTFINLDPTTKEVQSIQADIDFGFNSVDAEGGSVVLNTIGGSPEQYEVVSVGIETGISSSTPNNFRANSFRYSNGAGSASATDSNTVSLATVTNSNTNPDNDVESFQSLVDVDNPNQVVSIVNTQGPGTDQSNIYVTSWNYDPVANELTMGNSQFVNLGPATYGIMNLNTTRRAKAVEMTPGKILFVAECGNTLNANTILGAVLINNT